MQRIEGERWTTTASERRARGDAAGALDAWRRARAAFAEAFTAGEARRGDAVALDAAIGAYDAADLDRRRLGAPAAARTELESALRLADRVREPGAAAQLRFHANLDLGLLALATDDDRARAVEEAKRRLEAARTVPEESFSGPLRRARTRLLEAAIRVRDPDPQRSAQARADLTAQSTSAGDGEEWQDLRDDAQEQLRAALR
jgi:hypothetical protein